MPDAVSEVGTQSEATQSKPTFSRQELGADLNNIARNDGMSSRQSVNPQEALRTKRLVDMMMPVVGSFIDQDGEYYAAKLKKGVQLIRSSIPAKNITEKISPLYSVVCLLEIFPDILY